MNELLGGYSYLSSERAKRELRYSFIPSKPLLRQIIGWLVEEGICEGIASEGRFLDGDFRGIAPSLIPDQWPYPAGWL